MGKYHCEKHRQIKVKRGSDWVCPKCEDTLNPIAKDDSLASFMDRIFNAKEEKKR